jgi:hypothetical protein
MSAVSNADGEYTNNVTCNGEELYFVRRHEKVSFTIFWYLVTLDLLTIAREMKRSSHHNFLTGRHLESIRKTHTMKASRSRGVSTPRIRGTRESFGAGTA